MDDNGKLKDNKEKLFHTIAHELGHGPFGLEHVWQEKGTTQGATYNLMDYTSKKPDNLLRKYQWHFIHNPKSSWFGGEEDEVSSGPIKNNHPKDPAYYMNDPKFAGFTYEERLSAYMNWHFVYDIDLYLHFQFGNSTEKELYKEQILNPNEVILIKGEEYRAVEQATIKMALLNFEKHIDYWDRHKNDVYITYDEADWANEQVATRNRLAQIRFENSQAITVNDILSLIFDGAGMVVGTIILLTPNGFNYAGLMATLISADNFIKDARVIADKLNGKYEGDISTLGGSLMGEKTYSYVGIAANMWSGKGGLKLINETAKTKDKVGWVINSAQNTNSVFGIINGN